MPLTKSHRCHEELLERMTKKSVVMESDVSWLPWPCWCILRNDSSSYHGLPFLTLLTTFYKMFCFNLSYLVLTFLSQCYSQRFLKGLDDYSMWHNESISFFECAPSDPFQYQTAAGGSWLSPWTQHHASRYQGRHVNSTTATWYAIKTPLCNFPLCHINETLLWILS